MEKSTQSSPGPQEPEKGHGLENILKVVLLVAILVGAWFLLDRLITGK